MKWGFVVFVVCAFTGILAAPAVDEDDEPTLSSTAPSSEPKEETTTPLSETTSPAPPPPETEASVTSTEPATESVPEATSLTPEVTESPKTEAPTSEPSSGDITTLEPIIVPTTSEVPTTPEVTVVPSTDIPEASTSVVTSTSEIPEQQTSTTSVPEDYPTTTEQSWFTWITGSKSDDAAESTTTEMSATTSGVELVETTSTTTEVPVSSTTPEVITSTGAIVTSTDVPVTSTVPTPDAASVASKLSDQVRAVLQHYKSPDPTGFPGAPVPDPMPIPDMVKSFGVAKMTFNQVQVYGLSKFRIEQVNTDLEKMQVYVQLHMKRLVVLGNYTLRSWFNKAAGPFTVNLYDVIAEGAAALEPDEQGHLQASDTDMDMTFKDINMDFKNIGFAGSFFQGMVSSVGTFLFDSIKPYILKEVNTNMRRDVNAKIKTITSKLPSYISPVDLAISEGRKYVVHMGYDPYTLKDFHFQQSILHLNVSELHLKGLSQFYRVNDISLSMERNIVQIGLQLVTKQLAGSCSWSVALGRRGKLARSGVSNFTVEHLQIRAFVNQSLDIRHGPVLDDLDLEVGKVKLTMDGRGSLDYVIEIVVNQLPDLIRHIIVDALEDPIRYKVQSILDEVNLEQVVESKLPELDKFS